MAAIVFSGDVRNWLPDTVVAHMQSNPFACAVWTVPECPDFRSEGFSYWSYLITLVIAGPLFLFLFALSLSVATGEWRAFPNRSFRREAVVSTVGVIATGPYLAFNFKLLMEGKLGHLYIDWDEQPFWYNMLTPLLYLILSDFWFYWTHRLCHEVEAIYNHSHFWHHASRPTNSFAGNAADFMELMLQGESQVFFVALVCPIPMQVFVTMSSFSQLWAIFLHNGMRIKVPGMYDSWDHNVHHYYGKRNGNYGLYFQFWDRAMGTYLGDTKTPRVFLKAERCAYDSQYEKPPLPVWELLAVAIWTGCKSLLFFA
jgi:sterol desaturase/sphingolipid hydroxylase (fatty acid hydroxylase superfamily)